MQLKQIEVEIKTTRDLGGLLETYEELAAQEMKKIKEDVVNSRDFVESLAELSVKVGADLQIGWGMEKSRAGVFLSADEGLYGDLPERVFFKFLKYLKESKVEAVVVGRIGRDLMSQWGGEKEFKYYEESDEVWEKLLNEFGQLKMFFGQFENVARQKVKGEEVSGRVVKEMVEAIEEGEMTKYIYEPSAERIGEKFAEEIMTGVMASINEENRLAKQASRLVQLDKAVDRIEERVEKLGVRRRREMKGVQNSKQQARVVRMMA